MTEPKDTQRKPKPRAQSAKTPPETEWPVTGGSYTRDPHSGRLKPNPEADRANPAETEDGT